MPVTTHPSAAGVGVVYVLAVQNSGSTLLDAMLGSAPGARSLGEFAGFHRITGGGCCDCGRVDRWCGPCTAVTQALEAAAPGGAWNAGLDEVMGGGRLSWTVLPTRKRRRYGELASVALTAAGEATGARILIDSSKNVGRAAALLNHGGHDVHIVHLVRSPRGYLRSRQRRSERSRGARRIPMLLTHWLVKNVLAASVIRWRAGRRRYLRVHLEDLVARPAAVMDQIGAFTGLDLTGVADQATGVGVAREHFYEPKRAVDYATVRLDPARP